ncbi:MAG: ABC transporter substrate-binding protein, partial [Rhizobacter sp.]|nr:ABC transporter substrate-binding protein [Chlorobiales bacterium]
TALAPQPHDAAELVGISHECDYPESIRSLPVLTESKVNHTAASDKIHTEVQSLMLTALSLYCVKEEMLEAVQPDVIITQEQCKVCAVTPGDVQLAMKKMIGKNIEIVSLNPDSLGGIFTDIRSIGESIGCGGEADKLIELMRRRIEHVRRQTDALHKPRVAFIEWIDPIFIGGNWMPELIEAAGGTALFAKAGEHSGVYMLEQITAENPDVIVVSPCGFKLDQTERDLHLLTSKPAWRGLNAVQQGRVFLADGNEYFNRSSYRIIDSLEMLARMLHPETFPAPPDAPNQKQTVKRLSQAAAVHP